MLIVVTGGSGFVGRHLISELRRQHPAAAIRSFDASPPDSAHPTGVETTSGSVEDADLVREAVRGADVVIHLAARVDPGAGDSEALRRVNVEGAQTVFSAAVDAACSLFVHMSSAGVYGHPRHRSPFREDEVPRPVTPYQRTKWEAERVLSGTPCAGTTLNILRPAGIYGPGSALELPQYRRIRNQRYVVEIAGGVVVHPTYVDDVVRAILAVVARPAPHGTVFNLGGERPLQLQELQALQADALGTRRRRIVVPPWAARPLAMVAMPVLARAGRPNPLLAEMSRGALFSAAVDDSRFRSRYPDVPVAKLEDGLRRTIDWAREQCLL